MRNYCERTISLFEKACFPSLWIAISIYSYLFIHQSFFLYKRFALTAYDLGIYDQAVWLISRFHNPFITVRGLPLLADHFDPILFLLAPLYWIWASPKTLLVAQTLALGIGAWPIYLIAMRRLGKPLESLLAVFKSKAFGVVAIGGDTFLLKRGADHKKGIQLLARVCGDKISNEVDIDKALKAYLNI